MNPDSSLTPQEELEARLTALLLGELSPAEAEEARQAIARDPELAKLHERLKVTIGLVREAAISPVGATGAGAAPRQLSASRRETLLRQFKYPKPVQVAIPRSRRMRWFVPVSVAAMLVGMILIVATIWPRAKASRKENTGMAMKFFFQGDYAQRSLPGAVASLFENGNARSVREQQPAAQADAALVQGRSEFVTGGAPTPARKPANVLYLPSQAVQDDAVQVEDFASIQNPVAAPTSAEGEVRRSPAKEGKDLYAAGAYVVAGEALKEVAQTIAEQPAKGDASTVWFGRLGSEAQPQEGAVKAKPTDAERSAAPSQPSGGVGGQFGFGGFGGGAVGGRAAATEFGLAQADTRAKAAAKDEKPQLWDADGDVQLGVRLNRADLSSAVESRELAVDRAGVASGSARGRSAGAVVAGDKVSGLAPAAAPVAPPPPPADAVLSPTTTPDAGFPPVELAKAEAVELAPLPVKVPSPTLKGTPSELPSGPNIEPLSESLGTVLERNLARDQAGRGTAPAEPSQPRPAAPTTAATAVPPTPASPAPAQPTLGDTPTVGRAIVLDTIGRAESIPGLQVTDQPVVDPSSGAANAAIAGGMANTIAPSAGALTWNFGTAANTERDSKKDARLDPLLQKQVADGAAREQWGDGSARFFRSAVTDESIARQNEQKQETLARGFFGVNGAQPASGLSSPEQKPSDAGVTSSDYFFDSSGQQLSKPSLEAERVSEVGEVEKKLKSSAAKGLEVGRRFETLRAKDNLARTEERKLAEKEEGAVYGGIAVGYSVVTNAVSDLRQSERFSVAAGKRVQIALPSSETSGAQDFAGRLQRLASASSAAAPGVVSSAQVPPVQPTRRLELSKPAEEDRAKALYAHLAKLDRSELRKAIATASPDAELAELQGRLKTAGQEQRTLEELNRQVDERVDSLMSDLGRKQVQAKLDSIRIGDVSFPDIPLAAAIELLSRKAREGDPERKGVSITVSNVAQSPADPSSIQPLTGLPVGVSDEAIDLSSVAIKLPTMRDVTLGQALDAIAKAAERPIKLSVERDGIVIASRPQNPIEKDRVKADLPVKRPANAPIPQPEVATADNAFSTFSLNVSDVSFKLAAASLEKGVMPDVSTLRSEEFINAFDYRDPEPPPGVPVAFAWERARYPFAHNRDLLRFSVKTAARGREAGKPLSLTLLLDNSGSMERADRVRIIQESLRVLASQLKPQDKISVVTFSRTPRLWIDGLAGSQAGDLAKRVGDLAPQGGTNLEDAMNLAYQTASRHYLAGGVNRVVLLTDGAANLGNVDPEALKQKVEAQRKQGIALDCFGIGWEGYNDDLLEVLSRNGDGRYGFVNTPEEAATEFAGQLAGALQVAASDVKVQVEFNPRRVTAYRQIGYAKHQLKKEQFRDNTVDAAEIAAAEAGNALYAVEVNPNGEGPLGTVRVRFKVPGTSDYREHEWSVPFTGNAGAMEQASPAMRLASSAAAFSEWLASSPFAAEVSPDRLLGYLRGVPEVFGADARPKKLEWMIRQAKSLPGR